MLNMTFNFDRGARLRIASGLAVAVVTASGGARATPVPLPFTYPYETLQKGEVEDELYGDMTPLRVASDPGDRTREFDCSLGAAIRHRPWRGGSQLQTRAVDSEKACDRKIQFTGGRFRGEQHHEDGFRIVPGHANGIQSAREHQFGIPVREKIARYQNGLRE